MTEKIQILIADDHTIVRSGVRLLLQSEPDMEVVDEVDNGLDAVVKTGELRPDIVLMDIAMPGIDGLEATRRIKAAYPDTRVLVLTMHRSDEYFFEMLKAGASGYVLKVAETGELIHAVRIVARGEVYLNPPMAKKLLTEYLEKVNKPAGHELDLSRREKEILHFIAEGYSNTDIAEKLVISLSTVYTHRANLLQKLKLSSQHELIQFARQHDLMDRS